MTPCILDFTKTLDTTGTDPAMLTWFDVSGAVKEELSHAVSSETHNITYKARVDSLDQPPPFPFCAFAGSHIIENSTYSTVLIVSGGDPRTDSVTISGVRKNTHRDGRSVYTPLPVIHYRFDEEGMLRTVLETPPEDPKVATEMEMKSGLALLAKMYTHMALATTPIEGYRPVAKPGFINQQRKKKKKSLMYDWATVVIEPPKPRAKSKGGTHASPRHHERRGHMRRTRSGKQVWVRNHKVGNPANGTVFHDYMVKGETHV